MPEFAKPIADKLLTVLAARMPALCAAAAIDDVAEYGRDVSLSMNYPALQVRVLRTQFDRASPNTRKQAHTAVVRMAVAGADPEALAVLAMRYVTAVDDALAASWPGDWTATLADGVVMDLFVIEHDYGPLYEHERHGLARVPEIALLIETEET